VPLLRTLLVRTLLLLALPVLLAAAPYAQTRAQARAPELVTPARRWALVVGAGRYEHLGTLHHAAADAELFADALVETLGFERDTIRLLVDDAAEPELRPTAGHLLGELEALLKDRRRTRSDLFVFYFCGHGLGHESGDLLLPTDARRETAARLGLPVREVVERLAAAGMGNVLIVVDACRTGRENPFGNELLALAGRAHLALVLGCEPGGQSYEDAFLGHGLFTHALVEALREPELFDRAGGLWASRVAARARERVLQATARREPRQAPSVWNDPTRDVLLALAPGAVAAEEFRATTAALAPAQRLAAYRTLASELYQAGRPAECVEFLRPLAQLGPLEPELGLMLGAALQTLGRSVEAGRAFQDVRAAAPGSFEADQATLFDQSGLAAASERAEAAERLYLHGPPMPFHVLLAVLEALAAGGRSALSEEVARAALTEAPAGSRDEAYLAANLRGRAGDLEGALEALEAAEGRPGDFPATGVLREERVRLTFTARGAEAARELLDATIALAPEEGAWYAWRAWLARNAARSQADLPAIRADVRRALAHPLDPEYLLMATRAAGMEALALRSEIQAQAARHPLAWQAQIAATFVEPGEDKRAEVERVAGLAGRPALVYAAFASLMLDATVEDVDRVREERGSEPGVQAALEGQLSAQYLQLVERLTPMAEGFGGDVDAWNFLADLHRDLGLDEPLERLLERTLVPAARAGTLPEPLYVLLLTAALDAGREELADEWLARLTPGPGTDTLRRLAAAAALVRGDLARAAARLAGCQAELPPEHAGLGRCLTALRLALEGERAGARDALAGFVPEGALLRNLALVAWRGAGEPERAEALAATFGPRDQRAAFFARAAVLRSEADGHSAAFRAAQTAPGNPLTETLAFAHGLAAFAGLREYRLAAPRGPLEADGANLTLTLKGDGRVVGTLELPSQAILSVTGRLDEHGNLEAELRAPEGLHVLLAKLAPAELERSYAPLVQAGQSVHVLAPDGVTGVWFAHAKE